MEAWNGSLTWGYLQEKLTTTAYAATATATASGGEGDTEVFHFPVFLNTVQSAMAAVTGLLYLWAATPRGQAVAPIVPSTRLLAPLLLVALTSSLASPFGYAALGHIDYITYILAKSCKLLPVMFLHVTVFRRRYPLYKYLVVLAVTAGVAVFTLHTGSRHGKTKSSASGQRSWGLLLLGINLLFDGLTNSTQDYIFEAFRPFSGPQMMCANSLMQTAVTGAYLLAVNPWLVRSGVGAWLGAVDVSAAAAGGGGELAAALAFLQRHPAVWRDVLGFAACGAVGQIFICMASLLLCFPSPAELRFQCLPANPPPKSLRARHLLVRLPRHRHRHTQNVHNDPVRGRLWPSAVAYAVARRGARVWRHWRRGADCARRKAAEAGAKGRQGTVGLENTERIYIF